jgi:hypothetical protein
VLGATAVDTPAVGTGAEAPSRPVSTGACGCAAAALAPVAAGPAAGALVAVAAGAAAGALVAVAAGVEALPTAGALDCPCCGGGVGTGTGVGRPSGVAGMLAARFEASVVIVLRFAAALVDTAEFVWITSPSSPGLRTRTERAMLHETQLGDPGEETGASPQFHSQFQTQSCAPAGGVGGADAEVGSEQFQLQFHTHVSGRFASIP